MTDASPLNHYLLLDRSDNFQTNDKTLYAFENEIFFHHNGLKHRVVPSCHTDQCLLVRTIEEVRRFVTRVNKATVPSLLDNSTSPPDLVQQGLPLHEELHSLQLDEAESVSMFLDNSEDIVAAPWDDPGAQTDYWNWPVEILYQRYHLCIALDFGRATFDVSLNGVVYLDRVPSMLAVLLRVIRTTLRTREHDVGAIKKWIDAHVVDRMTRNAILKHVWDPSILVSIVLLNVPLPTGRAASKEPGTGRPKRTHTRAVELYLPDHTRFFLFGVQGSKEVPVACYGIPILSRCDANQLLQDRGFLARLRDTLLLYESFCREHAQTWPESNLPASIEYLVRSAPEASAECHSVVFVCNALSLSCSDSLSFIESEVRRKNLILSVVTLNCVLSFDTPQLTPLAHFIHSVGGLAVHVDYWLALATERANYEWCHRFEGARCLAQQLFVQLVNHFPVLSYGITQRHLLSGFDNRVPLYHTNKELLSDFVLSVCSSRDMLRAVASARFNEGWSVLVDYKNENTAAHLIARYQHHFHLGALVLHYEMDINRPVVYRRLLISGAEALVEYFMRLCPEEQGTGVAHKVRGGWQLCLSVLRHKVHLWMLAEQALLKLVDFSPSAAALPSLSELDLLSFAECITMEWLSVCAVHAVGVFLRYENIPPNVLWSTVRFPSSSVALSMSAVTAGKAFIKSTLLNMGYYMGTKGDELLFGRAGDAGRPSHLVQFFRLQDAAWAEPGLAGGFECRVSFFLSDANMQNQVLTELVAALTQAAVSPALSRTRSQLLIPSADENAERCLAHKPISVADNLRPSSLLSRRLKVSASLTLANQQALILILTVMSSQFLDIDYGAVEHHPKAPRNFVPSQCAGPSPPKAAASSRGKFFTTMLAPRALHTLHILSLSLMANVLPQEWSFYCAELSPEVMREAFALFTLRRLYEGFEMLLCHNSVLKAVLQMERPADLSLVFDVIVVHEQPLRLAVGRFITPHNAIAPKEAYKSFHADSEILTSLYTLQAFSTLQQSGERRLLTLRETGQRGMTMIGTRMESLLRYLHPTQTEFLQLLSAPSLGTKGCKELRVKVVNLVAAMGDRHIRVSVEVLRDGFAQLLSSAALDAPVPREVKVVAAVLHPIRYKTVIFLLVLETDPGSDGRDSDVRVALASLNSEVLRYGLMEQYRLAHSQMEGGRLPECCPDRAVIQSLRRMLLSFADIFTAHQLIAAIRTIPSAEYVEEGLLADIQKRLEGLEGYATEVDVSHLLYSMCHRFMPACSSEDVVKTLALQQARAFKAAPTLLFPIVLDQKQMQRLDDPGDRGSYLSLPLELDADEAFYLNVLPVVMKIQVVRTDFAVDGSPVREATRSTWVSCEPSAGAGEATPPHVDTLALSQQSTSFQHLRLRIFLKTVPLEMLDLCKESSFSPPPVAVRSVLRAFIYKFNSQEAPVSMEWTRGDYSNLPTAHSAVAEEGGVADPFLSNDDDTQGVDYLRVCHHFSCLPEAIARSLCTITQTLILRIALYALRSSFSSPCFQQLKALMESQEQDLSENADGTTGNDLSSTATGGEPYCGSPGGFKYFSQESLAVCRQVQLLPGLRYLLSSVVKPALMSSAAFQAVAFPVEFTQQATTHRSVDPVEAALDVFRRCVDEDHLSVVSLEDFCYVFIPNRVFFSQCWVMVHLDMQTGNNCIHQATILCYNAQDSALQGAAMADLSQQLRAHIYYKITQISQLHLLKQLRVTQCASTELIPLNWGDQFLAPSDGSKQKTMGGASIGDEGTEEASALSSTSFYLCGKVVLEIPIYYKLQHQCRKILSRIVTNCSRLELINIFNREQCFLVADDKESDIFHYIRLVFVKDMARGVSLTSASPPVNLSDRCPQLVVQLFTATTNALIQRPLRKLQEFCYFLAVQELQGQLNYVQQKQISFNDLVFLQNQRLEPLTIELKHLPHFDGKCESEGGDARLVATLLFLNLCEKTFKHFEVQNEEQSHATSTFVEHYNLEQGVRQQNASTLGPLAVAGSFLATSSVCGSLENPKYDAQEGGGESKSSSPRGHVLRFVKIVDGLTDVLVSCALRFSNGECPTITLERYLTKVPSERYTNGDSENTILQQLVECVSDTIAQFSFHALSCLHSVVQLPQVPHVVEQLTGVATRASLQDSLILRFQHFSLEDVSPVIYPFVVERLCGVLAPFQPCCCEVKTSALMPSAQPVSGFCWKWIEAQQGDPLLDEAEQFILCGYAVVQSEEQPPRALDPVRVVPYLLADLPVTTRTVDVAKCSALEGKGLSPRPAMAWRIVVKVSLLQGISVVLFNLCDSEFIARLISHALEDAVEKSLLLEDILMQRLGYSVPTAFNETAVARNCCGDATNVMVNKKMLIYGDEYRRRVNNVRFSPHLETCANPLTVIIEGLYNRGLIVNFFFALEDAIKVLYDEDGHASLDKCEQILVQYLECGVFIEDCACLLKPQLSFLHMLHPREHRYRCGTYKLAELDGVPADALVACSYHRHVAAAHIIMEAQNARSGVTELLARCDALWRAGPQNNVLELSKAVVLLLMRSQEVFGCRVPDFALHLDQWAPGDDLLDSVLPLRSQQKSSYAHHVDAALRAYIYFLRQQYPSLCIIDLDPNDPTTTLDPVLLNRLRCRYGKITLRTGEVVCFSPHLYYVVIPFVDLIRCRGMLECCGSFLATCGNLGASPTPITSSGLFIVEVGLQVVHYALDVFVINGTDVPLCITAKVAAGFKQSLFFSTIQYDISVRYLLQCLCSFSGVFSGSQSIAAAVANLVRHYPSPPPRSAHAVAVCRITDPRVMRLKNLQAKGCHRQNYTFLCDSAAGETRSMFMVLKPELDKSIYSDRTREHYTYGGLIIWETAQFFVLLATKNENAPYGVQSHDKCFTLLIAEARRRLLHQLLDSTQQERLTAAWDKLLCDRTDMLTEPPSYDEFELLRIHSQRVALPYHALLQHALVPILSFWDIDVLPSLCQRLFSGYMLRVMCRPLPAEKAASAVSHAGEGGGCSESPSASLSPASTSLALSAYNVDNLFKPAGMARWCILTFAPNDPKGDVFLAVECCPASGEGGELLVVETVFLYRRPSAMAPCIPLIVPLTAKEHQLIETFLFFLINAMWAAIMPFPTSFMC